MIFPWLSLKSMNHPVKVVPSKATLSDFMSNFDRRE